jgi:predicted ATPase
MIGAYRALAPALFFAGNFVTARQHASRGIQIWRSENVESLVEEVHTPVVMCLCFEALSEWHLGEITSCHGTISEAISLAKEPNDAHALALALNFAAYLAHYERNPTEVERFASELIELSTRHNFSYWLAARAILRGWARSASGDAAEGLAWIEGGIEDRMATGAMLTMPYYLALKAEALYRADRTSEALEAIRGADILVERSEARD